MSGIKRRLTELERRKEDALGSGKGFAKNYPNLVAQVRAEAEVKIAMGDEPDFYVDEAGLVRAASDGRVIHHVGEWLSVADEIAKQIDREIAALGGDPEASLEPEDDLEALRQHEEYVCRVDERLDEWGERGLRSAISSAIPGEVGT